MRGLTSSDHAHELVNRDDGRPCRVYNLGHLGRRARANARVDSSPTVSSSAATAWWSHPRVRVGTAKDDDTSGTNKGYNVSITLPSVRQSQSS
jgi:hypothetical protein